MNKPKHLSVQDTVNNGTYYTSDKIVYIVEQMIRNIVSNDAVIVDTSAGCGSFANLKQTFKNEFIFADIDEFACDYMSNNLKLKKVIQKNTLLNVSRASIGIPKDKELIIVGNPPYNDWTSKSKQKLKNDFVLELDSDLKSRDLGISFLKSYNKLRADYVCVLHPLSYLIKETNFKSLKEFRDNYVLLDSYVISSGEFPNTSLTKFPILIGLYKKATEGMTFDFIKNYEFKIDQQKKKFKLNNYITSDRVIRKYPPIIKDRCKLDLNLYFYPYRDINSLRTSKIL